jgi:hypothetical protein
MKLTLALAIIIATSSAAWAGPTNSGYKGDRPCSQGRMC